ncbi:putative autophagy-related protein [3] [Scheffersomyces coipomensis]|uniref:putative autophagy-related protein [3] n=1 Tax=Scheffersomyces coipomensis TaxID=1788519 RepID=UPI00315D7084
MSLRSRLSSLREYITPVNTSSNFSTTGQISPQEFVEAGDYLIDKFRTWSWGSCPENLRKSFLPPDKQFLITKHVPSPIRANNYLSGGLDFDDDDEEGDNGEELIKDEDDEDGWTKTRNINHKINQKSAGAGTTTNATPDIDDIVDLLDDENQQEDIGAEDDFDDLEFISNANDNLRRYDIYITYSTSYRVPKLYLVGFNSNGIPLLPKQMLEDISGDYKDKTATIESLPVAYNTTSVMIHPCRHASVMKVFMKHSKSNKQKKEAQLAQKLSDMGISDEKSGSNSTTTTADDDEDGIRVDQYLTTFLKFMSSVIPGIEYDFTTDAL